MDKRFEQRLLALLKPVSRSFYLSIRFLPGRIRPTMATAYLLARATDTIADANDLPAGLRLDALRLFPDSTRPAGSEFLTLLHDCARHQPPGGERLLLEALPSILDGMHGLQAGHQGLIDEVLRRIVRGQSLDLIRFEAKPGINALQTDEELDEYTYLVAGCVGEFWTKLCFLEWPGYSALPESALLELGVRFGQGLQLVNVLRDLPNDLRRGRCYLPVAAPERLMADPAGADEGYRRWLARARRHLEAAWSYTGHVRPAAVRFACALPALIGIRTLRLLESAPVLSAGVKVSRREVYRLAALALAVAFSGRVHRAAERRLIRNA